MKRTIGAQWVALVLLLSAALLSGCTESHTSSATASTAPASTAPEPATAATNPPGDIPDTQQFVTYASSAGFSVLYPEGWSRTPYGAGATFIWNYDGERLDASRESSVAAISKRFTAVNGMKMTSTALPAGKAVLATFTSQSKPDAVTGKSIRLENQTFIFSKKGRVATLDLWAPQGSDNVDQWRKISRSFAWR